MRPRNSTDADSCQVIQYEGLGEAKYLQMNNSQQPLIKSIKSILISQPTPPEVSKSPYQELTDKYKVKIDFRQFIQVRGLSAKEFRKQRVSILEYSAVIFTSRNAIDHFFRLCEELRIRMPEMTKYFCVSETIAVYLQKYIRYKHLYDLVYREI